MHMLAHISVLLESSFHMHCVRMAMEELRMKQARRREMRLMEEKQAMDEIQKRRE